jgi:hypothetical protein
MMSIMIRVEAMKATWAWAGLTGNRSRSLLLHRSTGPDDSAASHRRFNALAYGDEAGLIARISLDHHGRA